MLESLNNLKIEFFFILFKLLSTTKQTTTKNIFSKLQAVTAMKKLKNITRMEYKTPYGWWVRFNYNKQNYSKFFNDKKYGGKQLSLLSAHAWMKNTKQKANIPDTPLLVGGGARSNTGIRGVSFCSNSGRYFASWCDDNGKPGAASFSKNKYGMKKALKLACAKRQQMEEWRLAGNITPKDINKSKIARDPRKYSKEELIEILQDKYEELGRLPISRDFKKTSPNYYRFSSAFGGWNKAINAAGLRLP